ncbi:fimbrial protein [Citrobacter braakii]|jgi:type 1 fimbria pilin|uniref:fimbrial protein n=1 Tax=Citrobacter TaxID=544 RepID=UPI0015EA3CC4|nr:MULTISPECIES: fimbrial protein [Citrobacter]MCI1668516.1 fimbrial protein [Citrobacter freundii]MCI1824846.1 fimbrial protein [Citrobacter freundii]MDT7113920.1 fimbrial protein [Citrobacter braakii]QLS63958.1 fimbrial protein [Citrobacter sp. RHBSTW-00881]
MSKMKFLKIIWSAAFLMCSSFPAFATCSIEQQKGVMAWDNIDIGTIYAQRDIPVGQKIGTIELLPPFTGKWLGCQGGELISVSMFRDAISGFPHIYNTGIPGVGIKVYYTAYTQSTFDNPPRTGIMGQGAVNIDSGVTVDLYKTGPITSKNIDRGLYFQKTYGDLEVIRGSIVAGQVIQLACSLNSSTITVPLPDALGSAFTGRGTTKGDTAFTINLNCDAGTRINASLSGTQSAETSNNSILALSGAGTSGVARGIGIQLLYDNTPLKLNNNIVLKTSAGGQEFPPGAFTARYFQTKDNVTAGSANATATLNITYQ